MPATKKGTPVLPDSGYGHFTAEQLATLEEIKDRSFVYGIAQKKFVGQVLHQDGTLDKDSSILLKDAQSKHKKLMADLDAEDPDAIRAAEFSARNVQTIKDHIVAKRFLFILDTNGSICYFQCATENNPDLPMKATEEHREEMEEIQNRMQALIVNSHNKHAERLAAAKNGVTIP